MEHRGILRLAREMSDHFGVETDATLVDLIAQRMDGFRSRLMDELFYAPKILGVLNDSVPESIWMAVRMAIQGPEVLSPSTDHGVDGPLIGHRMSQVITASIKRLLARPTVPTKFVVQFLESDNLVPGILELAARKT